MAYGAAAVTKCIHGADFPISKRDIISKYGSCEVEWTKGNPQKLSDILDDVPDESFNSPIDLEKALKETM